MSVTDSLAVADELLHAYRDGSAGYEMGLPEIDRLIRGVRPGEFMQITGFAHSGKSQVMLNSFLHNPDKRIVLFTPDETRFLVLAKLVGMKTGVSAEVLEARLQAREPDAEFLFKRTVRDSFSNLLIVDDVREKAEMEQAMEEAEGFFGEKPDLVCLDYIDQFHPRIDDTQRTILALKAWGKHHGVPLIGVHQTSRGKGGPGTPPSLTSGAFGGEAQATFVLGIYRKMQHPEADVLTRERERETVSLVLVKNKRPPGRLTEPEGIDFHMDPATGLIRPLRATDRKARPAWELATERRGK